MTDQDAAARAYEADRAAEEWQQPDHWSKLPPMTEDEMRRDSEQRNFIDMDRGGD